MVFSSTTFLFIFLPLVLIFYYLPVFKSDLAKRQIYKNIILLIFSIGFYWWGEPLFVYVLLLSVILNYYLAILIENSKFYKKRWLIASVIFNILVLAVFKYFSFISNSFAELLNNDKLFISIALPIGISFYTFQILSYILDVYHKKVKVQKNLLNLALYITMFPQLIAGPIVRYSSIENEITNRNYNPNDFEEGVKRFIYGLAKKVLIANFIGQIADNVFCQSNNPVVVMAWIGLISYALQIYYDFSGYSDMAIGLGRMFGFHFDENFNYPYISKTIREFWKRWHISLSSWFRDYVYIPLGGSRVNKYHWIINMLIVWILTGIWHGANWTFLIWGLIYFVVLVLEKLTNFTEKLGMLKRPYTLVVILLAWVFFRSDNIYNAINYLGCLFGVNNNGFIDPSVIAYLDGTFVVFIIAIIGCTPFLKNIFNRFQTMKIGWIEYVWIILILVISISEVIKTTYNPFIYYIF